MTPFERGKSEIGMRNAEIGKKIGPGHWAEQRGRIRIYLIPYTPYLIPHPPIPLDSY